MISDFCEKNDAVRQAWNRNARFWDIHMGGGNEFFNVLE
jgi:hypothetical protein